MLVYPSALNLCQPLHPLETLCDRIIQDVDIQILHNTDNHTDALEESIDSDAQHAVRGRSVVHMQDILLLVSGESKRSAHQGRELCVDGECALGGSCEMCGWEGNVEGAVVVSVVARRLP
jgi:hypothetical protein